LNRAFDVFDVMDETNGARKREKVFSDRSLLLIDEVPATRR
jgi:hypothetical protein